MSDTQAFREAMFRAIKEWPISCEVNLTASNNNRQAWLGHAACCIAIGCPEETTRSAWWTLTEDQRNRADAAAIDAISEWERSYKPDAKARIRWGNETKTWRLELPNGKVRLFHKKRWNDALSAALSYIAKSVKKAA